MDKTMFSLFKLRFMIGKKVRDDLQKKRVKNGNLAQKVGRYQNKIPI